MATINDVPQLVGKKGGSYAAIAPKLEPGKFTKWKKRMLCYLARIESYYLKCIKDDPFQPKTADGDAKPESQWTPDERRVVVQDERLKSIIMSCLPDDVMQSIISCVSAKVTSTDLVHSFEGPTNTKENRIIDLKLEYQTFRPKSTESLLQTYTRYKTLLNELANDDVNLSKHEINDFQEKSDDEVDERSSEEYLRDLDIEYQERALLANSKRFIKRRNNFSGQKANENTECYKCGHKGHFARDCFSKTSELSYKSPVNNYSSVSKDFQPKFTPKLIQSSSNSNSKADPKFQKDYKAEYKKIKAKLALLEAKVSDEEEVTQVKVNILLSIDEDADWKNYLKYINIDLKFVEEKRLNLLSKYNKMVFELNKCRDELLILKQAKLDAITFQIQNTKLTKLNHALQEQLKEEKKINEKWLTRSKKDSMYQELHQAQRTVIVSETKQTTPSVPTEFKDTEQE
ncbi:retrovirus-related pol polyprotein from transposon TNT 1-94 [Tanacetum coccineum]